MSQINLYTTPTLYSYFLVCKLNVGVPFQYSIDASIDQSFISMSASCHCVSLSIVFFFFFLFSQLCFATLKTLVLGVGCFVKHQRPQVQVVKQQVRFRI